MCIYLALIISLCLVSIKKEVVIQSKVNIYKNSELCLIEYMLVHTVFKPFRSEGFLITQTVVELSVILKLGV